VNEREELGPADLAFIERHRVAHLATAARNGQPQAIPVCFVVVEGNIYTPIDAKPKISDARRLRRVRNIADNPRVSFVVDDYDEDWSRLAYVIVTGLAELREPSSPEHPAVVARLEAKYRQYATLPLDGHPLIRIVPMKVTRWSWRETTGHSLPSPAP
jgi:PPOX class probable F420-dependent enzyme